MSEKEKELYRIIGSKIKLARENKDLTNVEVAQLLKVKGIKISDTSLRRYESGEHSIKVGLLQELCKIYDLNYTELMKEAQVERLRSLDPSYQVFSKKDPNPIESTYGEDVAEIIEIYCSLNDAGKAQVMTQLKMIANLAEFTEKKGRDKMA